jgi:hypothetical protein
MRTCRKSRRLLAKSWEQDNPALERAEQEQEMAEQEIHQLGDLIPFLSSLQEQWAAEGFQPVLKLLAVLYKEKSEAVLYAQRDGSIKQQMQLAENSAVARTLNLIYNLPAAIKEAQRQLEEREEAKKAFTQHQESPIVSRVGSAESISAEKEIHKTYAATLDKMKEQKEALKKEGGN